jgi:hypothetical protein
MTHTYDPHTDPLNQPEAYAQLTPTEQAALQEWIRLAIRPSRGTGKYNAADSYSLKHDFERAPGFYITNGAFKGAMRAAGYEPVDPTALNWQFRIARAIPKGQAQGIYLHAYGPHGRGEFPPGWPFTIRHLPAEQTAQFDALVAQAKAEAQARWQAAHPEEKQP